MGYVLRCPFRTQSRASHRVLESRIFRRYSASESGSLSVSAFSDSDAYSDCRMRYSPSPTHLSWIPKLEMFSSNPNPCDKNDSHARTCFVCAFLSPGGTIESRHNGVTGYHRVLSWVIAEVTGTEATEPHTGGTGHSIMSTFLTLLAELWRSTSESGFIPDHDVKTSGLSSVPVSLHLQSRWLQEAPQRGALGIGGIVAVPIGTG
jgi:hypothetical protein